MSRARSIELTWQEMICLYEQRIGLRGVRGEMHALSEQKNGGFGDAVSLGAFGYPGAKNLKLSDNFLSQGNIIGTCRNLLIDEDLLDKQYPDDKAVLLERFHQGIRKHINSCINGIFCARSFILVQMAGTDFPYDVDTYMLGKCRSQKFLAEQVKAAINPPPDDSLWDTDTAYNAVVIGIKAFCNKVKLLEKQPISFHPSGFFTKPEETPKLVLSEEKQKPVPVSLPLDKSWHVII